MTTTTVWAALALCAAATAQDATSTAGHARARLNAELGRLPDSKEIVVDHIINYHRHRIPLPKAGEDVALDLRWDAAERRGRSVLQIGIATPRVHSIGHLKPVNLALVIDCSSSMNDRDKMSQVKVALRRFVAGLRPSDCVAVVTYSTSATITLPSTEVGDGDELRRVIERLEPGGRTNLYAGLMFGYEEVSRHFDPDATNRVILLTDGIANTGETDPGRIAAGSLRHNREGIDLSTIGVGRDFNRELLAELAESGKGLFHFVADDQDITKVFVDELQSLIGSVAENVQLRVDCDPGVRIERIFGYAPRRHRDGFTIELENFNFGVTNVVMIEARRDPEFEEDDEVRVELTYARPAEPGRRVTARDRTRLLDPASARGRADHEVRKNYAIARMAQAMRDMAVAAEKGRYGDADRKLEQALDLVRRHYASTDDPDLMRTRKMLEQYRSVLARRIDRYRR